MAAVLDGLITPTVRLGAVELHVMSGAQRFSHGIEAPTKPRKPGMEAVDGDRAVAWADAVIGGLELPVQRCRLSKPGPLLVLVEPLAPRLTYGGVARGCDPSQGFAPVERAIETLDEVIG